jgi:hypothetical protein
MRVVCVSLGDERRSDPWLTLNNEYQVISVELRPRGVAKLRIIADDHRTPILVDSSLFAANGESLPENWVCTIREGGTVEFEPKSWAEPDFWERYFYRDPEAVAVFDEELRRMIEKRSGNTRSLTS